MIERPDVGQLDLARIEQPDGEDLVAPVEQARAARSQPGSLMKSETTNTSERRLIGPLGGLEERGRGR